ncbi:MAG TPA: peptide ABC transporter substrate-binding protein, partial [Ktedonobacterales bacterium]|nr:peptide ABC transporter substrate-binding protein [Ktedonobacterales bacterium]
LTGCSYSSGTTTPQQVADAQQVLHDGLISSVTTSAGKNDLTTYDPAFAQDRASLYVASLVFPGLLTLDSQLTPQNWAIENVDISADGLTYTFHLRSGLRFTNGDPIDANTFAYTFNRILSPCVNSPVAYYLFPIKNAAAFNSELCADPAQGLVTGAITTLIGSGQPLDPVDAQTLKITLAQPAAYFLTSLTYPALAAEPVSLVKAYGSAWTNHLLDKGGLGGSLFKFSAIDHAGHITLARNTAFWGARPRLREIDFTIYNSATSEYQAYLAGKTAIGYPPADQYGAVKSATGFHETLAQQLTYIGVNWNVAPFNDLGFRQAFALAINKQSIANQTLQGSAQATNHIVLQGLAAYNNALKAPDGSQGLTGNTSAATNLAKAYANSTCGGSLSSCAAIVIKAPSGSVSALAIANAVAQMWLKVAPGYPISVRVVDADTLLQQEGQQSVQCYVGYWSAEYPDPQDWLSLHFGVDEPSLYNADDVSIADANTLMSKADAEADPTQRAVDYQAAEQLLVTQVAWIPLAQGKFFWRTRPQTQGFALNAMGLPSIYDVIPNVFIATNK